MESPRAPPNPVTVEVKVFTPEQLTKLLLFCKEHEMIATPESAAFFTPLMFDRCHKTPRPSFKEICGAAWLTTKGQIDAAGVYAFLQNYVKIHDLEKADGTIHLTKELREALQTPTATLYKHQLMTLVPCAFLPEA